MVAIVTREGNLHCSGSLIGAHTVLTAAHCDLGPQSYDSFQVFFGTSLAAGGSWLELADAQQHPLYTPGDAGNDLGLITLRRAAPAAPQALDPRPVDATWIGQTIEVEGFGFTSPAAADAGQRRAGTARVSAVGALDFTGVPAPSQPCTFDSGGPALSTLGLVGVASHGDLACVDHAVYARVDRAIASFLEPYLTATGPGSVGAGERCFYAEQCRSGLCLESADEPRLWFCSQPCRSRADCPAPMTCAPEGCRYPVPSPGATGWGCAEDRDCASGLCYLGPGRMAATCTRRCVATDSSCPQGFACQLAGGVDFYCLPVADSGCSCSLARPGSSGSEAGGVLLLLLAAARARRARPHISKT